MVRQKLERISDHSVLLDTRFHTCERSDLLITQGDIRNSFIQTTKPIIAIVGRPNVGKSTLFNRMVGERLAIVADTAGTTRDRIYADVDFAGRDFTLVDTGGLQMDARGDLPGTPAAMLESVRAQARMAIDEADAIIFLDDVE